MDSTEDTTGLNPDQIAQAKKIALLEFWKTHEGPVEDLGMFWQQRAKELYLREEGSKYILGRITPRCYDTEDYWIAESLQGIRPNHAFQTIEDAKTWLELQVTDNMVKQVMDQLQDEPHPGYGYVTVKRK